MLDYKLIEKTIDRLVFAFFPNGSEREGKVAFYSDGRKEVLEDSPDDVERYYASHALSGINTQKNEGYLVWC